MLLLHLSKIKISKSDKKECVAFLKVLSSRLYQYCKNIFIEFLELMNIPIISNDWGKYVYLIS